MGDKAGASPLPMKVLRWLRKRPEYLRLNKEVLAEPRNNCSVFLGPDEMEIV